MKISLKKDIVMNIRHSFLGNIKDKVNKYRLEIYSCLAFSDLQRICRDKLKKRHGVLYKMTRRFTQNVGSF